MKFFFLPILMLLLFSSCKNEKNTTGHRAEWAALEEAYNKTPNDESFNNLIQAVGKSIVKEEDKAVKEDMIMEAIAYCEKAKNANLAGIFQVEMLKLNPTGDKSKDYLWTLCQEMKMSGKNDVASILFKGFKNRYPDDSRVKEADENIEANMSDMTSYMKSAAEKVFEKPDNKGINKESSQNYIDLCESFALSFPNDKMAPEYLFRGAEISRALGTFPKTMSLYDWIYTYFPDYKKASLALFMKGFTLENEFNKKDQAKEIYDSFLKKYPADSLAKDVKFLLENISKSDKEILEEMEKKKK